jgi:hypothetical protein
MRTQTARVFWKDKFDGKSVAIDAADFNPAIHRRAEDGPWPSKAINVEPSSAPEEKTVKATAKATSRKS